MQTGKMRKDRATGGRHAGRHAGATARRATTELDVRVGVFRQPAMQTPVLVLNASYEPINICGARRALVLVLKGVARTEEEQGAVLHAARMNVAMPSRSSGCWNTAGFRTRRGPCRARTSCCATGICASTVRLF